MVRKDFKDIEFVVLAELEPQYECSVNYTIYDILGEESNGTLLFQKAGCDSTEPIEDMAQAEIFAHGSVKWDGCSNWELDIQKYCMIHACSRFDLERIGCVLARCWDMTAELCLRWDPGTQRELKVRKVEATP
jgi:hypothetical protein